MTVVRGIPIAYLSDEGLELRLVPKRQIHANCQLLMGIRPPEPIRMLESWRDVRPRQFLPGRRRLRRQGGGKKKTYRDEKNDGAVNDPTSLPE